MSRVGRNTKPSTEQQTGTITDWDDSRGFGWVEADGQRIFIHIKEFGRGQRRPKAGERVRFELGSDPKGRRCAKAVAYVRSGGRIGIGAWMQLMILLVLPGLALQTLPGRWWIGPTVIAALSLIAYGMYLHDKRRAIRSGWRVSEGALHLVELLGGWPGAFLAQRKLRHKCSKRSYQFTFWCIVGLFQLVSADFIFEHRISSWARVQVEQLMERAPMD
jgi:uncharacterized membrane protein YsdA (DUF1294 family)/cold shock CspA family protein